MQIVHLRVLWLLAAAFACVGSGAQMLAEPATVYRLNAEASFQEGCFDPCLCPLLESAPVRGTFLLGPAVSGDVVDFREIRQINWTVGAPGDTSHSITGAGNYRVTNYGGSPRHALELELSIDGGESQFFFSDFESLDASGGSIDLPVSMNGMYCYDIVIRVSASPVPRESILAYQLVDGSTYQQGCFDPCDCILEEPRPMVGGFALVPLLDIGTLAEFAVVNVRFGVRAGHVAAGLHGYSGAGRYTLIQGFAGPLQEMTLGLQSPLGDYSVFDSGLQNVAPVFPNIDIVVAMNDMVCFDRVLTIRARRPAHSAPFRGPGGLRR